MNVDLSEVADLLNIGPAVKAASDSIAQDVAGMVHARAVELAGERLHTRRKMFVDALDIKQVTGDVWVVTLDAKMRWIDDGQPEHNMLADLLASKKAKRSKKDGSKYVVVPFDHSPGKGKTGAGPAEQDLIGVIKGEMKKRGIPFGKIEVDSNGQAKIGRLHAFDIRDAPVKSTEGPQMGKGPVGAVRQGPTGTPFLQGVSVYQNKAANGAVKRSIMTFRIASSNHEGKGRWDHPGNAGVNIMDDAAKWATETFEKDIAPGVLAKILVDLSK